MRRVLCLPGLLVCLVPLALAEDRPLAPLFEDDFSRGADRWEVKNPESWKVIATEKGKAFSQFDKKSGYKPPHRSPFHVALIKDLVVGSFEFEARVQSTVKDYPHRDACVFFGFQDPGHLYYIHLGKKTDDHANQIFVVNGADRKKISSKTSEGTPWTDGWHHVKVVRNAEEGAIKVYFDDLKIPAMEATDKNFVWGQVGVGSFDDTTNWTDIKLRGVKVERPK